MSRADVTKSEFDRTDPLFRKACELAGTQPTPRQASKYRGGKGLAFKSKNAAKLELEKDNA